MPRSESQESAMSHRGFITTAMAAARGHVCVQSVYYWIKKGYIESTRVGRKHYVLEASLERYLGEGGIVIGN